MRFARPRICSCTMLLGLTSFQFTGCGIDANRFSHGRSGFGLVDDRSQLVFAHQTSELKHAKDHPRQDELILTRDSTLPDTNHSPVVMAAGVDFGRSQLKSLVPTVVDAIDVQSYQPAITFGELEQIAFQNNPTLREIRASIEAARGVRYQVGLPANPTLGYFGSQIADAGTDQHGVYIDQEIVRGGKLQLNQRILDQSIHRLRQECSAQQFRISTDIRLLYVQALAAQRTVQLCAEFKDTMNNGVQMAEARKRAGEGTQAEILQSQIQLNEVELVEQKAKQSLLGAWNEMVAIAGLPELPLETLDEYSHDDPESAPLIDEVEEILAASPELAAARARVAESRAALDRQRVQAIPNLNVQFGAGVDNGTGSNMINLQIGAPIPVFNNNCGNIQAAQAEFNRAHHELRRVELALRVRFARASQEQQSAQIAMDRYHELILPKARETLRLADIAYQAGELDFLQLLVARRTYFESSLHLVAAQRDFAQAQAQINGMLLVGGLDAPSRMDRDDTIRGQSFGGQ